MKEYKPLSPREEQIAGAIVEAAYAVHSAFGPGWYQENNLIALEPIRISSQRACLPVRQG